MEGQGERSRGRNPKHSWVMEGFEGEAGRLKNLCISLKLLGNPGGGLCRSDSQGNGSITTTVKTTVL